MYRSSREDTGSQSTFGGHDPLCACTVDRDRKPVWRTETHDEYIVLTQFCMLALMGFNAFLARRKGRTSI